MSLIIPNRRSFLMGLGATVVAVAETRAALIMPVKKLIRPSPVEHIFIRSPGPGRGLIFNTERKAILKISPGMFFEQAFPSFDLIAFTKASGLPIQLTSRNDITQEIVVSWFNGGKPDDFKIPAFNWNWDWRFPNGISPC